MKTYALAKHVVFRRTNKNLCMLFDRDRGVMYELNETASAVIGRLDAGAVEEDAIVASVLHLFEGEADEVSGDVRCFFEDFVAAGLVEVTVQ